MSENEPMNRRSFLKRSGGAAATMLAAGAFSDTALAAGGVDTVDLRKDALISQTNPEKGDSFVPYFKKPVDLAEGKNAVVKVLAAQAYQISYIAEKGEDGKNTLAGIVLPQSDGTMQIYKLGKGQQVQLRFMESPTSEKEVARTGTLSPNLVGGVADGFHLEGVINKIDQSDTQVYKNAYNNLAKEYLADAVGQFDAAKNDPKSEISDLKNNTLHLDSQAVGRTNGTIERAAKTMER